MSGHSKWSQIKRQKQSADQKRGNLFTKLSNAITVAARQGGGDQSTNFKLRLATEKAKQANMPNENIERAINKGAGSLESIKIEEVIYEGFGPEGIALVIEALSDNKNRTTSEIRNILTKYGGNLGNAGSVLWMFEQRGVLRISREILDTIKDKQDLELKIIDAGAQDFEEEPEGLVIYTKPELLHQVKDYLENKNITFETTEVELVPKNKTKIENETTKEKLNNIYSELEENDSINNYYTNAEI